MEVKIITYDKKNLEFTVAGCDQSLLQYLVGRLTSNNNVQFAAQKTEHPLVGEPQLIVRTKSEDPLNIVLKELEQLREKLSSFEKEFKHALS